MIILKSDMKTGQTIMNYAPQLYKRSILHFKRTNSTVKGGFSYIFLIFFLKCFVREKVWRVNEMGWGWGEGIPTLP